jgi:hypothetical protein
VPEKSNSDLATLGESLSNIQSGTLIVSVNNFPFLKIDGESKTLDVEIKGLKECGIQTTNMIGGVTRGLMEMLSTSQKIAKGLHEKGWKLRVFQGGSSFFSMGRGVSSLTGFVWGDPLKLLKILRST